MSLNIPIVRIMSAAFALVTLAGCSQFPVWFNGKYYGPPAEMAEIQPAPIVLHHNHPHNVEAGREKSTRSASQYLAGNQLLDHVYQKLSTNMTLDKQFDLSQDQTAWLNRRSVLCAGTGATSYDCMMNMTVDRISVLESRLDAMQIAPVAVASVALPPTVPAPVVPAPTTLTPPAFLSPPPPPVPAAMRAATYVVPATAMPWVWQTGGINDKFKFGYPDGTAPTVVPLNTLAVQAGQSITIKYVSGRISFGPGSPQTDALGYVGVYDHGENGLAGPYPSKFMRPYPINPGSLVGAFTDSSGNIIGVPFEVGNGSVDKQIPPGAARLQLGINDDIFGGENPATGNSGSFKVTVSAGQHS